MMDASNSDSDCFILLGNSLFLLLYLSKRAISGEYKVLFGISSSITLVTCIMLQSRNEGMETINIH